MDACDYQERTKAQERKKERKKGLQDAGCRRKEQKKLIQTEQSRKLQPSPSPVPAAPNPTQPVPINQSSGLVVYKPSSSLTSMPPKSRVTSPSLFLETGG